jgi:hypothetical protein
MTRPRHLGRFASALLALGATAALAAAGPETFTATASVKKGAASASAPVSVTVTRYATEAETAAVRAAAANGGPALSKALSALGDAGFIQLGERKTPIKFAVERSTGAGRLITILTAEPMLFLGAGVPAAKPIAGFDVAIAMLDLDQSGGKGELAPAAKVGIDKGGAIVIEDYGATVMWLSGLARSK